MVHESSTLIIQSRILFFVSCWVVTGAFLNKNRKFCEFSCDVMPSSIINVLSSASCLFVSTSMKPTHSFSPSKYTNRSLILFNSNDEVRRMTAPASLNSPKTYLRRIKSLRCGCAHFSCGFWCELSLASQTSFALLLPTFFILFIHSGSHTSRVTDLTLLMETPKLRCTPEHSMHKKKHQEK